jgi:hypothetical protein
MGRLWLLAICVPSNGRISYDTGGECAAVLSAGAGELAADYTAAAAAASDPTEMYGDNRNATDWAVEKMVLYCTISIEGQYHM